MIEPELMGHVVTLFNGIPLSFHRGCSFNMKSFLEAELKKYDRLSFSCKYHTKNAARIQ